MKTVALQGAPDAMANTTCLVQVVRMFTLLGWASSSHRVLNELE